MRDTVISAIHTDIQVLDAVADTVLEGAMMKAHYVQSTFQREGLTGPTSSLMLAGDYAGLEAAMLADPAANLMPALQLSDVPMLVSYAYDDSKHFVNINADALATLLPTTETRYLQLTGGHGSAPPLAPLHEPASGE